MREIRIEGEVAYVALTLGYEAVIDAADVHLVEGFTWCALVSRRIDRTIRSVYAQSWAPKTATAPRQRLYLHRVIADPPAGMDTDHIDGNGLNNRRENLRAASKSHNGRNRGASIRCKSGVKGVDFHKASQKWRAQIRFPGGRHCLGFFPTKDEAAAAYATASAELHGEFGRVE